VLERSERRVDAFDGTAFNGRRALATAIGGRHYYENYVMGMVASSRQHRVLPGDAELARRRLRLPRAALRHARPATRRCPDDARPVTPRAAPRTVSVVTIASPR